MLDPGERRRRGRRGPGETPAQLRDEEIEVRRVDRPVSPARVLIVEDDADFIYSLSEVIDQAGHTALVARSGRAALASAHEADLVLLDLGLPDRDGLSVCRSLRADPALARLPVIILTARDTPGDRVRGLEAGADDYVPKPFDLDELVARINSQLRTRQIEAALRERTRQLEALRHLTDTLVSTVAVDDLAQRIV